MNKTQVSSPLAKRFRGFYPVVIDVETAGFDVKRNPLLEIAAVVLTMDGQGQLIPQETLQYHIKPFAGALCEQSALDFNGIKPHNPFRFAISEYEALQQLFTAIHTQTKLHNCQRAIMVAHNPSFDQGFIHAAVKRCGIRTNPLHQFTSFDTATLGGLVFGQTVLARIVKMAGIDYAQEQAHSAKYDAHITAQLFCYIVNKWSDMGGWPLSSD